MNPLKNTAQHVENRVFRVLDANLNRATEAFRVLEEVARFGQENSFLTKELKTARHELSLAFRSLAKDLIDHRDTLSDIGTQLNTTSELRRENISDVANANFARLQQALRSLEEFGKIVSNDLAATSEQLRYRSYTLEKSLQIATRSRQDLSHHRLYVLIDGGSSVRQFRNRVGQLIEAGIHIVQLRDKTLTDRELLGRAEVLTQATRSTEVLSIINDRVDIAVASGADGVHLGQDELPVAAAADWQVIDYWSEFPRTRLSRLARLYLPERTILALVRRTRARQRSLTSFLALNCLPWWQTKSACQRSQSVASRRPMCPR